LPPARPVGEKNKVSGFASLRLALSAAFLGTMAFSTHAEAQSAAAPAQSVTLGPSGLPLPRFVSLKSGRVNSRVGPGVNYSVEWMYTKSGLPMEIVQEYDTWRRVRDADGSEGWINQSLLSGRRTAIVPPWQRGKEARINLLSEPDEKASVVAIIEPGVIGSIKACNGQWCEMTFDGHTGWLSQSSLWGAYPGEKVKD
jgi:SH3-like domain-containing protein